MNIENLKISRDHLLTIDSTAFRMSVFSVDRPNYDKVQDVLDHNYCGTAACVVGHATTVIPLIAEDIGFSGPFGDDENPSRFVLMPDFAKYSQRVFDIDPDHIIPLEAESGLRDVKSIVMSVMQTTKGKYNPTQIEEIAKLYLIWSKS